MQQKAAHELLGRQRHEFVFVVVTIVTPAKGDRSVVDGDQAMIRDRHAMGIAAEIVQDLVWAAKGRLGIHHPLGGPQRSEVSGKALSICQWGQSREELE